MFFLSDQQKYLLAVLHEIGCIRRAQAAVLLHRKFGSSPAAVTAILKQLKMLGKIREYDNVLSTIGESADTPMLQAVDLALAVFANDAPRLISGVDPFVLSAWNESQDMLLQIMHVRIGLEKSRSMELQKLSSCSSRQIVVLLLEEAQQCNILLPPPGVLLAYPDETGRLTITQRKEG